MRIIGGKYRGRKLKRVDKKTTRETADMVKEAVFNLLGGSVEGIVLDLFAGSGSYGLEALSRGASHLYAVDHDRDCVKIISENVISLGESDHSNISLKDAQRFLSSLDEKIKFDYVFIDPPYELDIYEDIFKLLNNHLMDDAYVICESKKQMILPETTDILEKIKERVYGIKRITIYQKK
ncbi:MAG: 16S rRNA (guanine(966)-N(2))-methyltransferase RsmD [Acholeplasmataceae bacterium]|nr:16S rRNA (guanine(966)-N(2))-methyltransferase RsmD [Acholeplasmataceae bacterium]